MTFPSSRTYDDTNAWANEEGRVYNLDPHAEPVAEGPDSWEPLDLGPYLRGEIKPAVPEVGLMTSAGYHLLYPGKEHSVIGEMECGKTWFTLACAASEITRHRDVVYIHFEECDPGPTITRLLLLGCAPEDITDYFHFVGPNRAVRPEDLARLIQYGPSIAFIDGVNEGMSLHSLAIREEDGAATFRRRLVKPFTAAGAAVVSCDHVIKDKEGRGRYALGSIHKGNAIDGAIFLLENAEPFGRGMRGRSHVFVTKDRPAHLRKNGRPTKIPGKTLIAELVVDDETYDDVLDLQVFAVSPDAVPAPKAAIDERTVDEVLCGRILDVITAHGGSLKSQRAVGAALREAGHGTRATKYLAALDDLVLAGRLEEIAHGASKEYRALRSASQDQDDSFDSEPP